MPKNLAELKAYLSQIQPWAAVAAVLGLALVAYYGFEGVRYWQAAKQTQALTAQRLVLYRSLGEKLRAEKEMAAELELERSEMEQLERVFHHPQTDELIGKVTDVARQNRVILSSISAGVRSVVTEDGVRYVVQPMSLIMEGQNQDVYRFFSALRQSLPVVNVGTVRMTGGGILPAQVNVQLSYYLSPQVLTEEEGKAAAKAKGSGVKSSKPSAASTSAGDSGAK